MIGTGQETLKRKSDPDGRQEKQSGDQLLNSTFADCGPEILRDFLRPISFLTPDLVTTPPSWLGHVPFAFWIMEALKPATFVELGAHTGNSYSAFCQAVKHLSLPAACYAVDTWAGDPQAGYYGDEVYRTLQKHHDAHYSGFSRLLRMTFDEANSHFGDGTIDLLHIDGLHTYEAVRHDFETWLPKMSRRGVVLFHDSNVREGDFGVWKLWDELRAAYPAFTFLHSHGLGVLGVGEDLPPAMRALLRDGEDERRAGVIRDFFTGQGERILYRFARDEIARLSVAAQAGERETVRLNHEVVLRDTEIVRQTGLLGEHEREVVRLNHEVVLRDTEIARLNAENTTAVTRLTDELAKTEQKAAYLYSQVTTLTLRLEGIFASTSWKVTAPLRFASRAARRLTSPHMVKRLSRLAYWTVSLQLAGRLRERRQVRLINASGLFDPAFYLMRNPDVAAAGVDPVLHYVMHGADQDRDPNPSFNTAAYKTQHPETTTGGINPLVHAIATGAALVPTAPAALTALDDPPDAGPLDFPLAPQPMVSVCILADGEPAGLHRSLAALHRHTDGSALEIILVRPAGRSTDEALQGVTGVRVVEGPADAGAAALLNRAANAAHGRRIALLAAGTLACDQWLEAMLDAFERFPDAGLVGARLLGGNGRIAEAGVTIHPDGRLSPVGAGCETGHPAISSTREVDACLSGCVMVPAGAWSDVGGLDERFESSDYALADLAMRLRTSGRRILCQPFASFARPAPATGDDWQQAQDRWRFRERWVAELGLDHPSRDAEVSYRQNGRGPRVLFIDHLTPTPDQDSGSADIYWYMRIFRSFGYDVTFIAGYDLGYAGRYTDDLRRWGITCLCAPFVTSVSSFLEKDGAGFDLVMLYRAPLAAAYMDVVRRHAPQARVVFDTVDLHYLREEREALLTRSTARLEQSYRTRASELATIAKADCTILLSQQEHAIVQDLLPQAPTRLIPIVRSIPGRDAPFAPRNGVVFVGGFNHKPNIDAITSFVGEVWPLVRSSLPDARLIIVGANPTAEVVALGNPDQGIKVQGFVEDLGEIFSTCRLSVAPLRYGAGIKGKVVSSLSYGLPCVATPVAAEGMGLVDGQHIRIAASPEEFAAAIVAVHEDSQQWNTLSENGLRFARDTFSIVRVREMLREMLVSLQLPAPPPPPPTLPVIRIETLEQYHQHGAASAQVRDARAAEERTLALAQESFRVPGHCAVCNRPVGFQVDHEYAFETADGTKQPNWREQLCCPGCGLNNRMRAAIQILMEQAQPDRGDTLYVTEQTTPLFAALKRLFPNTVGSEFLGDRTPLGTTDVNGVRNEDITRLTFPDAAFDHILSFDVLEHVPDYMAGLRECWRCLKPGGTLLFSVPFRHAQDTLVRARLTADGAVEHLLPPEYHGNPISDDGILCFYHFGWDLLERMRSMGYTDAAGLFYHSRELGYLGSEQFLFIARKP